MTTTFTHTLETPALPDPITHTVTMADEDFQTLVEYLISKYSANPRDPDPGTPPSPHDAIMRWLQESFTRTLGEVSMWQHQQNIPPPPPPLDIQFT